MKIFKTKLLTIAVLLCSISVSAHDFEVDGIYYNITSETDLTVSVTYKGSNQTSAVYSGNVIIPSSVENSGIIYSVTSIGGWAFYRCTDLTSIIIPNSVTIIGECAFRNCINLTSITIPNSVTSIGGSAFNNCSNLTSITIPNSVTSIGGSAFGNCTDLTNITVEEENLVYDSRDNCNAIIKTATNTLISGCQSTSIPNSVTSIGESAFYGCSDLTSITIPSSVTSIGNHAFFGCIELTNIIIPNSVTTIESSTFEGCTGLTSFTIPSSVTSIEPRAFHNCSNLTSITIPNSVTSIRSAGTSFRCSNLINITVEEGNAVYDSRDNCNAIIETATNTLIRGCKNTIIPSSVTNIGWSAFQHCPNLTSITIPESVTSIESYAFDGCTELTSITCKSATPPTCGTKIFSGINTSTCKLYVPQESIELYTQTSPWSSFENIHGIITKVTLVDGDTYETTEDISLDEITYTRTLNNTEWNALYVPFEIPVSQLIDDYEVAYINGIHSYDDDDNGEVDRMSMEVVKVKSGTLHANHPYLIKARTEAAKQMSITVNNSTLYKAESTTLDCSSVYMKYPLAELNN